jgi:hypothetical protein
VVVRFTGKSNILNTVVKPYTEVVSEQHGTGREFIYRTFHVSLDDDELVWHRDKKNRVVHVLSGSGWQLQLDDSLPEDLKIGQDYHILKETFHRVIKGQNDLVVRIENI